MFNALKYTQELEKAGFTREQAEASLRLLIDVMNENFATKADLQELRADLKSDIAEVHSEITHVRSELRSEISQLRSEVRSEFSQARSELKEVEYRMTIKLGGMMTLAIGVTATLVRMLQGVH